MTESKIETENRSSVENSVLTAVQKGFTKVSNIVGYCASEAVEERPQNDQRELDVPRIMRTIERLIQQGYVERKSSRLIGQLNIALTEKGKEAATLLPDREHELIERYQIPREGLQVLALVIEFQNEIGSLPSVTQLESKTEADLIAYEIQPYFALLVETGLARSHGFLRFKVNPTEKGEAAIKEFDDLI